MIMVRLRKKSSEQPLLINCELYPRERGPRHPSIKLGTSFPRKIVRELYQTFYSRFGRYYPAADPIGAMFTPTLTVKHYFSIAAQVPFPFPREQRRGQFVLNREQSATCMPPCRAFARSNPERAEAKEKVNNLHVLCLAPERGRKIFLHCDLLERQGSRAPATTMPGLIREPLTTRHPSLWPGGKQRPGRSLSRCYPLDT